MNNTCTCLLRSNIIKEIFIDFSGKVDSPSFDSLNNFAKGFYYSSSMSNVLSDAFFGECSIFIV